MNDWKTTITLLACCVYLTAAPSVSADYVGVTTVNLDDPDTEFLCTQGNGDNVPGPLTVCHVFAVFDDPDDTLLSVSSAELQVYNGKNPDIFFFHPLHYPEHAFSCSFIPIIPDLICGTFITLGFPCRPPSPEQDGTTADGDFSFNEFAFNGHIVGGWYDEDPSNGQGVAGNYPDSQVLFLQSSVAQGLSLSGEINIFWQDGDSGEVFVEADAPLECAVSCGSCPTDTDYDGDTDAADLALLLGNWGPVTSAAACLNADGDGLIGPADLAVLLGAWGPCAP